jgi:hypothetical protein
MRDILHGNEHCLDWHQYMLLRGEKMIVNVMMHAEKNVDKRTYSKAIQPCFS